MSEVKMHSGSCHCGAVRYDVKLDLSQPALTCNCSMCGRSGAVLAFVPTAQFELRAGEGALTDYQFNKHVIHHVFCRTCGIKPFARGTAPDGSQMVAINLRCLDGVDLAALQIVQVDGKSR